MKHYEEQMPLYVAGQLDPAEIPALEEHLLHCSACRAELDFWRALSGEILAADLRVSAPPNLAAEALRQLRAEEGARQKPLLFRLKILFLGVFSLLRAQAYLVKREMWPASAAILALGVVVALVSKHIEVISFAIPMIAAASLALLYGPEVDPAYELALAAPTPPWKILLARLSVVAAYNLVLSVLASLAMLLLVPPDVVVMIVLGWLAPMAFLSALALLLSLWLGSSNAVMLAYGLWIIQYLNLSKIVEGWGVSSSWNLFLNAYRSFWQSSELLLVLSLVLLGVTLLSTRFSERGLNQTPA